MNICKEAVTDAGCLVDEGELERINALARSPLKAEEVYTFAVRLCDNEVDRDLERFDIPALEALSELFVGKTGIFDHQWSAQGQSARIYRTELVTEEDIPTSAGEPYTALKGYAYMVRTEENRDLIREIEGGIKKEVSISCAVEETLCSICGEELYRSDKCVHTKGKWYGGQQCCGVLTHPTDAYEWSFVAVPAQRRAGVVKGLRQGDEPLKSALARRPDLLAQVEQLEEEARLGRAYLAGLRREVLRLGGLADGSMDRETRKGIVDKLAEPELRAMKSAYEARLEEKYPPLTQLRYGEGQEQTPEENDGAFLI